MATITHEEAHAHTHGPELQHQFETPEQQKEAATLGMWAFLVTEIMLFGGIFMAYIAYRWAFPEAWEESAALLNTPLATVNTVVLLVSSLTVALAVNAAEEGRKRRLITMLVLTIVLGVTFLVIKGYEYSEKFAHCAGAKDPISWITGSDLHESHECLVPGRGFMFPDEHGSTSGGHGAAKTATQSGHQLFFLLYFSATGLHAIHMIIGLGVMTTILVMALRDRFSPTYFTPVEIGGLYWHLIDIIWVFLFPLFYLV
ncbi:cytochrome C oxidase subunit III [Chloroflexus islandicus]|uniref:Cytochrome C oxidase subunit III n=1 Tax=Chloroflexus islandicus TaxID=1707952 RepID=A0A178LVI0_9CHLR|nr:cytochrome c oxidase subunit 3 family protein [Chloroflexus islandicus]OAN38254.1 cytochrome C oxidase subunit III [Chloroflexus islandicus]